MNLMRLGIGEDGRRVLLLILVLYAGVVFISPQSVQYQRKAETLIGIPSGVWGDGYIQNLLTRAIVEHQRLYVADDPSDVAAIIAERGGFSLGVGGKVYITALPAAALLAVPFYLLMGVMGYYVMDVALGFITCVLVYKTCRLYFSEEASSDTTLFFALGTMIFTYSEVFYPDILSAALVMGSFYALLYSLRKGSLAAILASGMLAGLLPISKTTLAPAAALFAIYALRRANMRHAIVFVAGFALCAWTYPAYNILCFGSPFASGYGSELHMVGGKPQPIDVNGMAYWMNNPLKTIPILSFILVLTNPLLLISALGLRRLPKDEARLIISLYCLIALIYGLRSDSIGGLSWSWRFMLPMVPPLALPAACALEARLLPRRIEWTLFYLSFYITILSLAPIAWHILAQTPLVEAVNYKIVI
jgi:hypothetical protein